MITFPPGSEPAVAGTAAARPRPMLRGWSHAVASIVAVPAGVLLTVAADGARARTAAAIYGATLVLSFGTSAAYHLLARSPRARERMQRLDHAMIYLLIAGTYVPASLLGLPPRWGIPLLSVVGTGALLGVFSKVAAFDRGPRWLGHALYPLLGWAALPVLPLLIQYAPTRAWVLMLLGGLAYTIGFPVLLLRRPDPWPTIFGYHEIWHVCTIVAAILQFGAVVSLTAQRSAAW